jgi:hypothetical protein
MTLSETILRWHVWLLATLMPLLVKLVSLRRLIRLLDPPARLRPFAGTDAARIVALVDLRLASPHHMRRRACLRKGLVLFHCLRLAGLPGVLHFSVNPRDPVYDRMQAHCWVTLGGRLLTDPAVEGAVEMLTYPQAVR